MIVIKLYNIPPNYIPDPNQLFELRRSVGFVARVCQDDVAIYTQAEKVTLVSADGLVEQAKIMAVVLSNRLLPGTINLIIRQVFKYLQSTGLPYCPFVEVRSSSSVLELEVE